ncbi:MAG: ABC transporter permease subunit [Planctomycetes bacterium]|nr:ABC transporter permease subunit [Planctomycetota bacterium]
MIGRIWRLLANELLKLLRQWWAWIILGLPLLVAAGVPAGLRLDQELKRLAPRARDLEVGGYQCLAEALHHGLYLGSFIFLIYAAQVFSGERWSGQLRDLLAGPVRRGEVVLAKWLSLLAVLACFYFLVIAGAAVSTVFFFDLGDVREEGAVLVESAELFADTIRALYLFLPPAVALFSMGLLISALTSNPGISAALAIVAMGVFELAKGIFSAGPRFRRYLFNDWLPSPFAGDAYLSGLRQFAAGFSDALWRPGDPEFPLNLWVPLVYSAVFLALALFFLSRKEIAD